MKWTTVGRTGLEPVTFRQTPEGNALTNSGNELVAFFSLTTSFVFLNNSESHIYLDLDDKMLKS